jgi:hypothetical protein
MRRSVIVVLIALGFAVAAFAQTAPPRPLHQVGDHWTPYDPPQAPPEGMTFYIIQPGDTLWDLAQKNLGDPYLWPQIWEQNKYITDAHWIYPGDPLLIAAVAAPSSVPGVEEAPPVEAPPAGEAPPAEEAPGIPAAKPVPIGDESDVYCYATVTPEEQAFPLAITGTDESSLRFSLTEGQIVYVNGGTAQNVHAGDEFFIIRDGGVLKSGDRPLGRLWLYTGRLIVLCAQENTATAKIMSACQDILRNDRLAPFSPFPIPARVLPPFAVLCPPDVKEPVGRIVHAKDDMVSIFQGHMVTVDLGSAHGVKSGDLLRIYRYGEEAGAQRIVQGRLGILTVQENTATARVLESVREIHLGDLVEFE